MNLRACTFGTHRPPAPNDRRGSSMILTLQSLAAIPDPEFTFHLDLPVCFFGLEFQKSRADGDVL